MASLNLKNVYKIFDEKVTAVNDFNLEIKDKEFIVLVGPSGCGKSTTLRMIAGLEEISQGEVYIGDEQVNETAPKDRDIAMVFQNYALYPHMTVFQNMAFGLKLKKMPKNEIDKRVQEAAKILEIEELLDRKPKALSGGQRQRVALGRAIVRDPKVFLMDEPLSNLDAKLRVVMRTEIAKLHQKLQTTFIYVTHDQTEAMTMGDRIVVMKDGVINQVDTPLNLYNNPINLFVAGFIGSPQMNFLQGKIEVKNNSTFFVFGENYIQLPEDKSSIVNEKGYLSGSEMIMGIRPEDIFNDSATIEKFIKSSIEGKVEVTEIMGADASLFVDIDGQNLVARVESSSQLKPNTMTKLALNPAKIHLFDKQTEESILY
ncbi:sn-glycerol-3-phosphate ABC transporter ATP-binding protein UgpC [Proteinivorax tanatarense]|uniref:Sn-glycerol-3-phosphate ABC transporter ATP-binding protein UgpC n=1 Tax=Proteinivorax tanatarense TaxID=1260629 RepID=A0AAU7VJI6_9FIRM